MNFKQWHDDETNRIFCREVKLYFAQCDKKKHMHLDQILELTADSAVEDYHQRGISFDRLQENNYAFLVSRVALRFHKMPVADQLVSIRTWERGVKGMQLFRDYDIFDTQTGETLISGKSAWLLVNPQTKRILRPSNFSLRDIPSSDRVIDCMECGKIAACDDMQLFDERKIRYSDIDANGHMNNARYGAFIIDSLPKEYKDYTFSDFRINYAKEANEGDTIHLYGCKDEKQKKIKVTGKNGGEICFDSELYYG